MKFQTAQPYIASYVILRRDSKIACILRKNTGWMDGYWGLPAGKVEKSETFIQAAVREAREEAGVEVKAGELHHLITVHRFDPSSNAKDWVDIYFEADKWDGEPFNAEPHVHSELAWQSLNDLPKNMIPAVRFTLNEIKRGKVYSEYGWEKA